MIGLPEAMTHRRSSRTNAHQSRSLETEDFREGIRALLSRREPRFVGKWYNGLLADRHSQQGHGHGVHRPAFEPSPSASRAAVLPFPPDRCIAPHPISK